MNNIEFLEKQIAFHQEECTQASNDGDFEKFRRHDKEVNNYRAMLVSMQTQKNA